MRREKEHLGGETGIEHALITGAGLYLSQTSKFKASF